MPYRSGGEEQHLAQEGSVVDDLVRQFADPYAFLRELVQNAIDAGARHIRVHMDRGERVARWSVEDDGAGMTLAILEGPLLTAFSSSKEGDASAIGKYGVGFLSVFGMAPHVVRVLTHRAEGAWEVRLFPDHAFEIEALPPREGHGTTVIVEHPVPPGGDAAHEDRGEAALRRWCRHAALPIELDRPTAGGRRTTRVDRPLGLTAPVVIEVEQEGMVALVGPAAGTDRLPTEDGAEGTGAFAGFYNRGLTLVEMTSGPHVVPGLRFKVSSGALHHTLSRDDVKHDREHGRAVALVRQIGAGAMCTTLTDRLRAAAEEASRTGSFAGYDALLAAAFAHLPRGRVRVPLVPPRDGAAATTDAETLAGAASIVGSRRVDGAARELVRRGLTLVRLPDTDDASASLARDLAVITGKAVVPVADVAIRLVPRGARELGSACDDLAEAVAGLLGEVGEDVAGVTFAVAEGPRLSTVSVFAPAADELPIVVVAAHLQAMRDAPGRTRRLVLLADHPLVAHAVRIADDDHDVAAALLVRVILLEHRGAVPAPHGEVLLARAGGARP